MDDILCPNCQKDKYDIIEVNGVKVKQCKLCGSIYQLAEKEIGPYYILDCKDENGNFVICPVCGSTHFKRTEDIDIFEDIFLLDFILCRELNIGRLEEKGKYFCLNRKCYFSWDDSLNLKYRV